MPILLAYAYIVLLGEPSKLSIIMLFGLLVLFLAIWLITGISPKQRYKKVYVRTRLVKKPYLELNVTVESSGKLPVEIDAPEIKFYDAFSSRKFIIRNKQGNQFPLTLYPRTNYDFKVDFERFYLNDTTLRKYKKVELIIREKGGRLLSSTTTRLRYF